MLNKKIKLMKPPFLQLIQCWILYLLPHAHVVGRFGIFHPYLRRSASQNCCLVRSKPCFGSGRTFNQLEAPFSQFMRFSLFCGFDISFFKLFNKSIHLFSFADLISFLMCVVDLLFVDFICRNLIFYR